MTGLVHFYSTVYTIVQKTQSINGLMVLSHRVTSKLSPHLCPEKKMIKTITPGQILIIAMTLCEEKQTETIGLRLLFVSDKHSSGESISFKRLRKKTSKQGSREEFVFEISKQSAQDCTRVFISYDLYEMSFRILS